MKPLFVVLIFGVRPKSCPPRLVGTSVTDGANAGETVADKKKRVYCCITTVVTGAPPKTELPHADVDHIFKGFVVIRVRIRKMPVVWADFAHCASILQYDLQAVLCLPFAITFKRRIHTFVTVSASLDVNLFTKFYESPNVIRR